MYKIAVIPGDGIGPEVTEATLLVLRNLTSNLEFIEFNIGFDSWRRTGKQMTDDDATAIAGMNACLKGPTTTPPGPDTFRSIVVTLRQKLDLYANVRPVRSKIGVRSLHSDVDLIIVRENTEGMYKGLEFRIDENALAIRVITRRASERIARFAFQLARQQNRKKVTIVHKANVLKQTCGLFREICLAVSKEFPEVQSEEMIVDAAALRLVTRPQDLDVIVTTNLFGDILSDEAAGVIGGLGLVPSANLGDHFGLFEPVHGSAPQIAGKGIANPAAMTLSAAMMLRYLDMPKQASELENAVHKVIERGATVTSDLGGNATTMDMAKAIAAELRGS